MRPSSCLSSTLAMGDNTAAFVNMAMVTPFESSKQPSRREALSLDGLLLRERRVGFVRLVPEQFHSRPRAARARSAKCCDLALIQDYLGHKQIQNTVRYTALNPARFVGLW